MGVIKSVMDNDKDILKAIKTLYLNNSNFDLDPCFSKGTMYKGVGYPTIKMDKTPLLPDVIENDIVNGLPLPDDSINNVIFDPPFMFGKHGKTNKNIMKKRFTMFETWNELELMYKISLKEFFRVLKRKGILAFKCQDYTDSKTTLTHCHIHNWALKIGFKIEDLFIKISNMRIWNSNLKQRHSRKFHCYWLVFRK